VNESCLDVSAFQNIYIKLWIERIFLESACGLGICSCVGAGLLSNGKVHAAEKLDTDWKEGFIKYRFAKLIDILDLTLDEKTKNQIIENLGKECAKEGAANKYKDNPEGFFEEIHNRWGENATYDKEKGLIRIETPERDCVCPFVNSKVISKSICQCSVGWQTQTYTTIFGKEVKAKCLESVVRGSKRCVFEINV
jgi:predicted hydrocarbon binding protein